MCRENGGDLISINSPVEQAFFSLKVGKYGYNRPFYIGEMFLIWWINWNFFDISRNHCETTSLDWVLVEFIISWFSLFIQNSWICWQVSLNLCVTEKSEYHTTHFDLTYRTYCLETKGTLNIEKAFRRRPGLLIYVQSYCRIQELGGTLLKRTC